MTPVSVTVLWQPAHLGADWSMCSKKKSGEYKQLPMVQLTWTSRMSLLLGFVEVKHSENGDVNILSSPP